MTAVTVRQTASVPAADARVQTIPFISQLAMLSRRSIVTMFRDPAGILPGVIIGVFVLLIYDASLSGAAAFFLRGQSYLGFILPLSVISTALSGAGIAGQAVVRDIESGYFDKLLLTPISRPALLLAPMIGAAVAIVVQTLPIIILGVIMGLQPATGGLGLLALLGYALLIGLGLAGFIVGIALLSNSSSATNGASFLFFPFTFLTATFTPLELLSGWIRVAAELNPITYLLEATRGLLNVGWQPEALTRGLLSALLIAAVSFTFAAFTLRARTRRR